MSRATCNGKTPTSPLHELRASVAGCIIKWCITIAQKICFICFEGLHPAATIVSLKSTITQMHTLDFDHCMPRWKSPNYNASHHWFSQPLVAHFTDEKKSGASATEGAIGGARTCRDALSVVRATTLVSYTVSALMQLLWPPSPYFLSDLMGNRDLEVIKPLRLGGCLSTKLSSIESLINQVLIRGLAYQ